MKISVYIYIYFRMQGTIVASNIGLFNAFLADLFLNKALLHLSLQNLTISSNLT